MRGADRGLDCQALACELSAAVREAGTVALRHFKSPIKSWLKNGSSPVSEADIAVDLLLRERLDSACRDCAWLSEETEDDPVRLVARRVWIVDPIDGTRAFLAGLNDWTISIALVEAGRPLLAALYAPVADELFFAIAGTGAFCNEVSIAANAGETIEGARVAGPKRYLDRLATIAPKIVTEPKVHSLALRIARVAQGRLDVAFAASNSHDWDLAAADLLVHEAGGVLTTLAGRLPVYNRPEPTHGALIAAGRGRHEALIARLGDRASAS